MSEVKQGGIAKRITNVAYIGDVSAKATTEIETLTSVISYLTNEVQHNDTKMDFESEPDLLKKTKERFADYESQIKTEYVLLLPDYGEKYDQAWAGAEASEECRDEIDGLISLRSLRALEDTNNNPITAIDIMVNWLKEEIGNNHAGNQQGYSEMAIRFFIFKEFARCHVFPNIK